MSGIWARKKEKEAAAHLQKECNLDDPAAKIRDRFVANWKNAFQVTNVISYEPTLPGEDEDLNTLSTTFSRGTILDFKTTLWQIRLDLSAGAGHFRVDYQARGRLVRLDDGRVVWQGWCNFASKSAPHRKELLADRGAVLKAMLQEAADTCVQELWAQFVASNQ